MFGWLIVDPSPRSKDVRDPVRHSAVFLGWFLSHACKRRSTSNVLGRLAPTSTFNFSEDKRTQEREGLDGRDRRYSTECGRCPMLFLSGKQVSLLHGIMPKSHPPSSPPDCTFFRAMPAHRRIDIPDSEKFHGSEHARPRGWTR